MSLFVRFHCYCDKVNQAKCCALKSLASVGNLSGVQTSIQMWCYSTDVVLLNWRGIHQEAMHLLHNLSKLYN